MRKVIASALLAGLVLLPVAQASASAPRGGGGGIVTTGNLGMARLTGQNGRAVTGAAFIAYSEQDKKLDVVVQVSGLAPNSVHPAHIHQGTSCAANGPVLFPLPNLVANAQGVAIVESTINAKAVPSRGWYVNVHLGPDLKGAHFTPISCGVVRRPTAGASLSSQNGSKAQGLALLVTNRTTSDVVVIVTDLAPNSVHPEHIHQGASCSANGPVLYPLPDLMASSDGIAVSSASIPTGVIPSTGWYINVHRGPDLKGPHFTPIACGTVEPAM